MANYRIICAGYDFPIEFPTITWKDRGYNSHAHYCAWDVQEGGSTRCVIENMKKGVPASQAYIFPYDTAPGRIAKPNRYGLRPMGKYSKPPNVTDGMWEGWGPEALRAAQATVRQFVIHMDGCADPLMTYRVLHNDRGLSVHFILDNDGTIHQTLDLALTGFHCKGINKVSIGIEINNRGRADNKDGFYGKYYERSFYDKYRANHPRYPVDCFVHGHKVVSYNYTDDQFKAMHALDRALRRALPNLAPTYPQDSPGVQSWGLAYGWREEQYNDYTGWIGHYHTTRGKWDPGPFNFKEFFKAPIATQKVFPMPIRGMKDPVVYSNDSGEVEATLAKYFENNEQGDGGFFPIGRWGEHRLWHTGIHLSADKAGVPVRSPFPGRVVAVRNGPADSAVGSTNFVLIKHEFAVGPRIARFFSLYFHLARVGEPKTKLPIPKWKAEGKSARPLGTDELAIELHDESIDAGEVIGFVGEAGPDDRRAPQLHLSIFAPRELGETLDPDNPYWVVKESLPGLRYVSDADMLGSFEQGGGKKDGLLTRDELLHFFQNDSEERDNMRKVALLAVTEWNDSPPWDEALRSMPEFSGDAVKDRLREELIESQINPTIWWTGPVAEHAELPTTGMVYSYHPVTFIKWLNDRLATPATAAAEEKSVKKVDNIEKNDAKLVHADGTEIKDDWDDKEGESFADEEDFQAEDHSKLTIVDIANGYPEET